MTKYITNVKTGGCYAIMDLGDPVERFKNWLDNFDPDRYTDKSLKKEDFILADMKEKRT